ncbi:MAG: alpha-ketoacid dehydrogenase subunit beta [Actinobacteria bacterium]|nr:alpha-ketoacid dehydrogenase subunit beta [Actinomycetota bacterium]
MREISYAEAVRECLRQQMQADNKVFMIGEDIGLYGGAFGVSAGLVAEFGQDKIMDTPISEQGIVGIAIGASLLGMRPVAEIMFSDFTMLPLEQIANQAGKIRYMFGGKAKVPIVIRTPGGAGMGMAAQHSQSIEALFLHFPGLKVVMPSTPYDVKGLLAGSIRDDNPVMFFEHKLLYPTKGNVPQEPYEIPLGKADIKREGKDITIVATSFMVGKSLKVAEKLSGEGVSVEVVDPRTIKPLDIDLITGSIKKTGRAVLVEEACYTGGFTCYLASEIIKHCFDFLDAPVLRVTGLDCPIPYEHNLENAVIPDEKRIEESIKKVLGVTK